MRSSWLGHVCMARTFPFLASANVSMHSCHDILLLLVIDRFGRKLMKHWHDWWTELFDISLTKLKLRQEERQEGCLSSWRSLLSETSNNFIYQSCCWWWGQSSHGFVEISAPLSCVQSNVCPARPTMVCRVPWEPAFPNHSPVDTKYWSVSLSC